MKISELVEQLLSVMKEHGDLEVFDCDSYSVDAVSAQEPTEEQRNEYDMTEMYCQIESFNR